MKDLYHIELFSEVEEIVDAVIESESEIWFKKPLDLSYTILNQHHQVMKIKPMIPFEINKRQQILWRKWVLLCYALFFRRHCHFPCWSQTNDTDK